MKRCSWKYWIWANPLFVSTKVIIDNFHLVQNRGKEHNLVESIPLVLEDLQSCKLGTKGELQKLQWRLQNIPKRLATNLMKMKHVHGSLDTNMWQRKLDRRLNLNIKSNLSLLLIEKTRIFFIIKITCLAMICKASFCVLMSRTTETWREHQEFER